MSLSYFSHWYISKISAVLIDTCDLSYLSSQLHGARLLLLLEICTLYIKMAFGLPIKKSSKSQKMFPVNLS